MSHTNQNTQHEKPVSVAQLRQQVAEADSKRRDLLASVFLSCYEKDIGPIVRKLFASASADVLVEIEKEIAGS